MNAYFYSDAKIKVYTEVLGFICWLEIMSIQMLPHSELIHYLRRLHSTFQWQIADALSLIN